MRSLLHRWIAFNGVGSLGILIQLGVLMVLFRRFHIPYLWATAIAVEAAVLHNFMWHQRWTWRDRPVGSLAQVARRLVSFHALNGAISLTGNLLITRVLTGAFEIDPVASNIAGIIMCSMLNFASSELVVFGRSFGKLSAGCAALLLTVAPSAFANTGPETAELRGPTLHAWSAYERELETRLQRTSPEGGPFFALDAYGIAGWNAAVLRSGYAMYRLERPQPAGPPLAVPDGKIHHWAGAVFVPGLTVERVLQHLSTYSGRESEHYSDVLASRLISRNGNTYRVFLKLRRTKLVTVTYNTEHTVEYRQLGKARAVARSVATRIAELADVGTPKEREKPDGKDQGFLWRLNAYWRYEAVEGGVLIECESISLSRAVPSVLRPFISGVVEGIARESLEKTLVSLKNALLKTAVT